MNARVESHADGIGPPAGAAIVFGTRPPVWVAPEAADLSHGAAEPVASRSPSDGRFPIWIGFAIAIAVHAAALAPFAIMAPPEPAGSGGQWLEAISVDLVPTRVIEARETVRTDSAGGAGSVAPDDGDPSKESAQPSPASPTADRHTDSELPSLGPTEALTEDVVKPEPEEIKQAKDGKQEPQQAAPENKGGVAALAVRDQNNVQSRATANAGTMQRYATQVRAALARSKPSGRGMRGTATIAFGISNAGTVSFARLSSSSGNTALDQAVLSAVRRTSFPAPPGDMTEAQLTYVVPFHFK